MVIDMGEQSKRTEIILYGVLVVGGFALLMLFFNKTETGIEMMEKVTEGMLFLGISTLAFFKRRLPMVINILKGLMGIKPEEEKTNYDELDDTIGELSDDVKNFSQELMEVKKMLRDISDPSGSDIRARLLDKLAKLETKELEQIEDGKSS